MSLNLDLPPAVEPVILDIPPLVEAHVNTPGVYVGIANTDPVDDFIGASVISSHDDGGSYDEVQSFKTEVVLSRVVGTLGGGVTGFFWDTLNTLRVQLNRAADTLSNETDEDVAAGRKNILLVGNEIVGFAEAVAVAGEPRTWDLTRLLRGRRDTHQWIDNHVDKEQVVMLSSPSTLQFVPLPNADIGEPITFGGVSTGQSVVDTTYVKRQTPQAENVKPFAPVVKPADRDADGNITIQWTPRSKRIFRLLALVAERDPDCCCCDQYEIDVWTADRVTLLRTYVVCGRRDFVYTVERQVEDFGSTQSSVEIDVFQVMDLYGRGRSKVGVAV